MSLEIACMFVALLFCTSLRSQISLFCSILAVALYMHFATSVIHEITNALGIHCFRFVHQFITTIFFSTCFHQSVSWNKFCLVTGSLGKRHNSHPRALVFPWIVIYHKWCLPDKKISIFISITSAITGMVAPWNSHEHDEPADRQTRKPCIFETFSNIMLYITYLEHVPM